MTPRVTQARSQEKGIDEISLNGIDPASGASIDSALSTQRLADYLRDVRESGDISNDTGELAWTAWRILWEGMAKRLPVPDAAAGPNGELLYAWNEGEHHLELEIFPNAPAEFFYRNRSTGKLWERPYRVGDPVSMEVREHLSLFS